jgi:hypothetical protein
MRKNLGDEDSNLITKILPQYLYITLTSWLAYILKEDETKFRIFEMLISWVFPLRSVLRNRKHKSYIHELLFLIQQFFETE